MARITSAGAIERIDLFRGAATSCFSHSVANVGAIIPDRHVLVIRDAGAYASSMASNYNTRPLAPEILVEAGEPRVIRRRQTVDELLALED